jgi:hypothetical protein
MSNTRIKGRKKNAPPRSRIEGTNRIQSYVHWLYGKKATPQTIAPALLDAAFAVINEIDDETMQRQLLREALERAYLDLVAV